MRKHRLRWLALIFVAGSVGLLSALPSQASAAATKAAAPNCGPKIMKTKTVAWKCTFDDEFNGTKLDASKWTALATSTSGYRSSYECEEANNATVAHGYLDLTVRHTAQPFICKTPTISYAADYTGASVASIYKFSQDYGLFSVRAKFPSSTIAGLQSTLWLYPTTNTTNYSGEIDIAEWFSSDSKMAIPYVHYLPSLFTADANVTKQCKITSGAFHTYTMNWSPTEITVQIDGTTCLQDYPNVNYFGAQTLAPFNVPFFLNLTQVIGQGGNTPTANTQLPASTYVDYVRVWK